MRRALVIATLCAFTIFTAGCGTQPDGSQVYMRNDGKVTQVDRYHDSSSNTTTYKTRRYDSNAEWQQSQLPDPAVVATVVLIEIGKAIYNNWDTPKTSPKKWDSSPTTTKLGAPASSTVKTTD